MSILEAVSPEKYSLEMRLLHWGMALCFVALYNLGLIMVDLEKEDPLRPELFGIHKSIGVLTIAMLARRLWLRKHQVLPDAPAAIDAKQWRVAQLLQKIMYGFMIAIPVFGWAHSDLHGRGVKLFGMPLPKLFPTIENIGSWPGDIHGTLAYALLGLTLAHVAGLLKHRLIGKVDLLKRII